MDSIKETTNDNKINSETTPLFSDKNSIIIILISLLLLSFLGINLLQNAGDFFQFIINGITYFLKPLLSDISFITGTVIDNSSDIVADTSKTGIDIAQGSAQSIADLFIKASGNDPNKEINKVPLTQLNIRNENKGNENKKIDEVINSPKPPSANVPKSDSTTSPIQKPITSNKAGWCLIDEYKGQRNCVNVTEDDKCMSEQVYPTQKMCLNPTLSK